MANQLFDQVELVASVFSELYLPTLQANLEYMSETLHLEVEAFRKVKTIIDIYDIATLRFF